MGQLYLQYEFHFASAQLVLAMLGMGATLRGRDFMEVMRSPKGFGLGLFAVLVAGPFLAFGVGRLFGLEPGLATGLVLVAAVPGGTLSNLLTYFAHGNVALSVSLTATATAGCLVSTPIVLKLFATGLEDDTFVMPVGQVASDIVLFLLGPLGLGMALGSWLEARREQISRLAIRASLLVIVVMIVGATSAGRVDAGAYGGVALLAMFTFCGLLLLTGLCLGWAFSLPSGDVVTLGIETAFRNTGLAIMIKASVFPIRPGVADPFADQVLFIALLYGGFGIALTMLPLFAHRRMVRGAGIGKGTGVGTA
jgi:BASS family bile acid:Na+ symporter